MDNTLEFLYQEAMQQFRVVNEEIQQARSEGRKIASIIVDASVSRGDVISIIPYTDGVLDEDGEEFSVRVVAVLPTMVHNDSGEMIPCQEALCIVLDAGDATSIDTSGMWITPGVIDVHSHLGVYASPGVAAHSDGNEMSKPVTAEL